MTTHALWIPGRPKGHTRPVYRDGGYRHRTDRGDLCWRQHVRAAWLNQIGPLRWSSRVAMTLIFVGCSADLDNAIKAVWDALGARGWDDQMQPVYQDDRQVTVIEYAAKLPSPGPGWSGVFIAVEQI